MGVTLEWRCESPRAFDAGPPDITVGGDERTGTGRSLTVGVIDPAQEGRLEGNACGPVAWAFGVASLADPVGRGRLG